MLHEAGMLCICSLHPGSAPTTSVAGACVLLDKVLIC